ncbi:phosphoglycerate kinase [Pelagibacterales bacterium SAG-MED31]|nr:phosphoglycerate kinase [Pelagibacterales bacterium SAG-MED31]
MKNLSNYKINHKKVLFRADLNVPVVDGKITDLSRILVIKSSIEKLIENKNKIFIIAHFGRPKGEVTKKYSLKFILSSLADILKVQKVHFLENLNKENISNKIDEMEQGEICLVENIRFEKSEEKIDLVFAKNISRLFDVYVNDAFSASHRNHTSIIGFAKYIPAVAGNHLINEIHNINTFLEKSKKPNLAIVGGSKISTKINLLNNLIQQFSCIVIGGAMANTFLLSNNIKVRKSLVEKDLVNQAKNIQKKAIQLNCRLILPKDVICGKNIEDKNPSEFNINEIPSSYMILDIGSKTTALINKEVNNSKTVLWNGPLGAFEYKPYDKATNKIALNIRKNAKKLSINTLAGGGDTISSIKNANAEDGFDYISNAGGAFLEWLEGNQSPGVIAIEKNNLS